MRIILLLNDAPDYRESFLRRLGKECELTVLAHPCESSNLKPPNHRKNYNYIELTDNLYSTLLRENDFQNVVDFIDPHILCISLNLRFPNRIVDFYRNKKNTPWIWWGQVFGKNTILNPLKLFLISKSDGVLVYTEDIANKVDHANAVSFNNSQFSIKDFVELPNIVDRRLKLVFVGRPQERKRLNLAIKLAKRRSDVFIRLIGPGMLEYFKDLKIPTNVELFPAAYGDELKEHFKWSNLVINPGHAGLLVMNAATHHRAILINSAVDHAPEIQLAKEAEQFFVDFEDSVALDSLISYLLDNPNVYFEKANLIHSIAINNYTVEHMAEKHMYLFHKVLSEN